MPHHVPSNRKINRRRIVLATGGAMVAAPFLGQVTASAADGITATMVTDTAGIGDESFNDMAKAGGDRAVEELGIDFKILESQTAADYVRNLTDAAEQSELTIATGFLLQDALADVAPEYPDRYFTILDTVVEGDNIVSWVFREQEGSFLAGVLAAQFTTTGTIGFVGGIRIPPVMRYEVGYVAGAKSINPDIEILISYVDDFEDPGLGKEHTLAQYKNADIVLAAAGRTGIGAFDAAKEKGEGFYVIAADQDQSDLGPEFQLAAVIKKLDTAVFDACQMVNDGAFEAGTNDLGIAEEGIDLDAINENVPQEMIDIVDVYKAAIADGTIVPPVDDETLETFEFVSPEDLGAASPEASPAS